MDWRQPSQIYPEGQSGHALQAVCGKGDVVDAIAGGRLTLTPPNSSTAECLDFGQRRAEVHWIDWERENSGYQI